MFSQYIGKVYHMLIVLNILGLTCFTGVAMTDRSGMATSVLLIVYRILLAVLG